MTMLHLYKGHINLHSLVRADIRYITCTNKKHLVIVKKKLP